MIFLEQVLVHVLDVPDDMATCNFRLFMLFQHMVRREFVQRHEIRVEFTVRNVFTSFLNKESVKEAYGVIESECFEKSAKISLLLQIALFLLRRCSCCDIWLRLLKWNVTG